MSNLIQSAGRFCRKMIVNSGNVGQQTQDQQHREYCRSNLPEDFKGFEDMNMPVKYLGHSTLQPVILPAPVDASDANNGSRLHRGKTKPESTVGLAAVSSDEATSSSEEDSNDQSLRRMTNRADSRSFSKALAALPPDFQDRISFNNNNNSSSNNNNNNNSGANSRENINNEKHHLHHRNHPHLQDSGESSSASSSPTNKNRLVELEEDEDVSSSYGNSRVSQPPNEEDEDEDGELGRNFYRSNQRVGIIWDERPVSLSGWIESLKQDKQHSDTIVFIKTQCLRDDCKCAFRRHDTLVMYALVDACLAHATWEKALSPTAKLYPANNNSRIQLQQQTNPQQAQLLKDEVVRPTEVQANIMIFRQCRGWYEVLNENNEAIPHWTSVDQIRIARPSTFLTRSSLRCLLAPDFLAQAASEPHFAQIAASPDTLAASQPCLVRAGTLFKYVDFLPNCTVRKGRRTRLVNLILAMERYPGGRLQQAHGERYVYIGTEQPQQQQQQSDWLFPHRLAVSQLAGPENISGVHSMAGVLRKFRLPISVRPVAMQDPALAQNSIQVLSSLQQSESDDLSSSSSNNNNNKCPLMPELIYTDRHLMRLRSILRGDVLLMAAADNPARFFIITPGMLKDHAFYFGHTTDHMYLGLLASHRTRTMNFIATAHKKDSLDYLLQFMNEASNRDPYGVAISPSMEFYSSKMASEIVAQTGADPRVGPACDLKAAEVDQIYEEIEDIYFYIRNGYYPTRRQQQPPQQQQQVKKVSSTQSFSTDVTGAEPQTHSNSFRQQQQHGMSPAAFYQPRSHHQAPRPYTTYGGYASMDPHQQVSSTPLGTRNKFAGLQSAEQLLAASLKVIDSANNR